jgi:mono/diheme cytochrome c family protein
MGAGRRYVLQIRHWAVLVTFATAAAAGILAVDGAAPGAAATYLSGAAGDSDLDQVLRGRQLVIYHGCGDCHGGGVNPAAEGWLAGNSGDDRADEIGEYRLWARNLTPHPETGVGRYTDRQLFNALRFGLRPGSTADVEITSSTPGVGNHPHGGDYLAPIMPWSSFRHMTDQELRDIIAYLRTAVRPVHNPVPDPEAPAGNWAGFARADRIGAYPLPPFPAAGEALDGEANLEEVLRGRALVVSLACGECHGGRDNPAADGWLAGVLSAEQRPAPAPFEQQFSIGPFTTWSRNITPDNTTGIGRFSQRQIFNALRYGLRPGETADVEITSASPGVGNHPQHPKYLAPPMPWPAWRNMSDQQLWDIASYLKHGVKPFRNRVPDSEGPPDFWAGEYTEEKIGPYPVPAFPTARERMPERTPRP